MNDVFAKVSDMILPPAFRRYFLNRLREISALYQSGIIQRDPALDALHDLVRMRSSFFVRMWLSRSASISASLLPRCLSSQS